MNAEICHVSQVTPAMSSWERHDLANTGDAHLVDVLWLRLICVRSCMTYDTAFSPKSTF